MRIGDFLIYLLGKVCMGIGFILVLLGGCAMDSEESVIWAVALIIFIGFGIMGIGLWIDKDSVERKENEWN